MFTKKSWLLKNFFDCRKFPWWRKNLCLWKMFLTMENFLDKGKIFSWWKYSWWRKNVCPWKIFVDQGKILVCGKFHSWRKDVSLWKTSLIKERLFDKGNLLWWKKYFLMGHFLNERKLFAWWWKNAKDNLLLEKGNRSKSKTIIFYFGRNHSQLNPVEHY